MMSYPALRMFFHQTVRTLFGMVFFSLGGSVKGAAPEERKTRERREKKMVTARNTNKGHIRHGPFAEKETINPNAHLLKKRVPQRNKGGRE